MNKNYITELIEKYIEGTASPAEYQQLLDWYKSVDHTEVHWPESEKQFDDRIDRIRTNILSQSQHTKRIKGQHRFRGRLFLIPLISVAAAVLVILLVSSPFYKEKATDKLLAVAKTAIVPGGNKAILTLNDGSSIDLTDSSYNNDSKAGLTLYTKQGELTFSAKNATNPVSNNLNTLHTPRGGQYMVNLPDGSKVWLNAESALSFPNNFDPNERKVILKGEAYFDIAKNENAPFMVSVDDIQIEVLGTQFNINAYRDAPQISTTLVEGSVKVSQGIQNIVLKPNQQSNWHKTKKEFHVETIDPKVATAWKNGYFVFEDTNIKSIMSQLSRWYDLDVEYLGDTAKKVYTGSILKRSTIQEVLDMLELTGTIKFKIKGRRISVMP